MATTTRYPKGGEPATIHFDVVSKQPTRDEAVRLTSISIQKKPVSGAEVKDALKWCAVGVLAGIALWFFGRWVIGNFRGLGVLFFGYGFAYLAAPVSIIFGISNFFKLFRSAQKTKPEAALRWLFEVSYLGEDAVGSRFGKPEYAVATLERIVPGATRFDREAARAYITSFRDSLTKALEVTARVARQEPPGNWSEGGAQKQLKIDGTKELFPGVLEMRATLSYKDVLTRSDGNNNTVNMIAAALELHIVSVMIKAGKYWFPYDIAPTVTCRRELPEIVEAETPAAIPAQ